MLDARTKTDEPPETGAPLMVRPSSLHTGSSRAAERCAREILDTVPLLMRVVRAEMRRRSGRLISVPQFRALAYVHRHPGVSLAGVAEHLGVTPPTASTIVDRLVRAGLLVRAADPRERRRVALALTPSGARLFARLRGLARQRVQARLAGMPAADLQRIARALAVLGDRFREDAASDA
jgi:DNA-binding MarR family transcriptional regulator